jgi:hypothetical protein
MLDVMDVAVVGDDGSGKETFIGLLYSSQIRYSNENRNKNLFKFYASPLIMNEITSIYSRLRSGEWPEKSSSTFTEFSVTFRYMSSSGIRLSKFFKKDNTYTNINLNVYFHGLTELVESIRGMTQSSADAGTIRKLLSSRGVIILIDSSKLSAGEVTGGYGNDRATAKFVNAIGNSAWFTGNAKQIFLIMIFTKFDNINRELFRSNSISEQFPLLTEVEKRKKYCEDLMTKFFPETLAELKRWYGTVNYTPVTYFYSSILTEFDKEGNVVPALKERKGMVGNDIEYSYNEYRALIEYLRAVEN